MLDMAIEEDLIGVLMHVMEDGTKAETFDCGREDFFDG